MNINRRTLRGVLLLGWVIIALLAVVPVLAQGDEGTTGTGSTQLGQPENLNEFAARLAPLLVGAALIERVVEFLFSWAQRAALDATATLRKVAMWISGLVQVDFKQAWVELDKLTDAMVRRQTGGMAASFGNPASNDPADWPLADLQERLDKVETLITDTQTRLEAIMSSDLYKSRKKMVAAVLSIAMGLMLAFSANLHVFEALDIDVADWFDGTFGVIDIILAGVLMGLGTDWVHQVINILTKGQGLLGRAAGGGSQLDEAQVQQMVGDAVAQQLNAQVKQLGQDIVSGLRAAVQPGSGEPPAT